MENAIYKRRLKNRQKFMAVFACPECKTEIAVEEQILSRGQKESICMQCHQPMILSLPLRPDCGGIVIE